MIDFNSLGQGDSYTARIEKATIFVAPGATEAARFTRRLGDPDLIKKVQETDFEKALVVAVFRGPMGSSGYGIKVQSVGLRPGEVRLTVKLTNPAPDQIVSDVITYPYHVITVPGDKIPRAAGTLWTAHAEDGALLAQIKFP